MFLMFNEYCSLRFSRHITYEVTRIHDRKRHTARRAPSTQSCPGQGGGTQSSLGWGQVPLFRGTPSSQGWGIPSWDWVPPPPPPRTDLAKNLGLEYSQPRKDMGADAGKKNWDQKVRHPSSPVDRHTPVKTVPSPSFGCRR